MTLRDVPVYGPHEFVFGSRHRGGIDICGVCEEEKKDCIRKYKPKEKRMNKSADLLAALISAPDLKALEEVDEHRTDDKAWCTIETTATIDPERYIITVELVR